MADTALARFEAALDRLETEEPQTPETARAIHAVFLALEPTSEDMQRLSQASWLAGNPGQTEADWAQLKPWRQLVEHDRVTAILKAYFDGMRDA